MMFLIAVKRVKSFKKLVSPEIRDGTQKYLEATSFSRTPFYNKITNFYIKTML